MDRRRSFTDDELEQRDALNPDIFWLHELPEPDVLTQEIADDVHAALERFAGIAAEPRG